MSATHRMNGRHREFRTVCVLALSGLLLAEAVMAQTTDQPPKNPIDQALQQEVDRAKLQASLAEEQQKKAEAERKELEAQLPKATAKGTEGSVTVGGGAGYYAELLAYSTLQSASKIVVGRIRDKVAGKTVILTDQFDMAANDTLWQSISLKLDDFDDLFTKLKQRYPIDLARPLDTKTLETPAALLVGPAILGAAADIAAFFRVSREITGRTVTLSSRALVADVASHLAPACGGVVIPALRVGAANSLVQRLRSLQKQSHEAAARRDKVRVQLKADQANLDRVNTRLTAKRAELEKLTKEKPGQEETKAVQKAVEDLETELLQPANLVTRWTRISDELDKAVQAFDAFEGTLLSRPAGSGLSPIETVAAVDQIRDLGDKGEVLYVGIASQGAEIEITKSAWTSGRISYVGGSVVTFFLISGGGAYLASGSLPGCRTDSFKGRGGSTGLRLPGSTAAAGSTP
jgi:hypothetical protein